MNILKTSLFLIVFVASSIGSKVNRDIFSNLKNNLKYFIKKYCPTLIEIKLTAIRFDEQVMSISKR